MDIVEHVGAWDIPPIIYQSGWESWRVIVWGHRSVRELFQKIRKRGELRVTSLRPIENVQMEKMMLVPASDLFSGLTERQISTLVLGLEHGYYSLPSGTKVEALSEGIGLSPSTLSEHLRKAEARILTNLQPHIQAYASRGPGELAMAEIRPPPRRRPRPAIA